MIDAGAADAALERARGGGVTGFVVPATKLDDAEAAVAVAARHGDVWAAVGFHPHEAKDFDRFGYDQTERLAANERVVAIGEVGLDYHYLHSTRETQRDVFMQHVALAKKLDLPLIIHNRESTGDLLELLTSGEARGARGVLHSFTEHVDVARKLIDLGFYISFSGIVTFRNADSLREVARTIPLETMLIETDTPYLAPVPHRGKENEPAYVVDVAAAIARVRGIDVELVGEQTSKNFENVFGVKLPR